MSMLKNSVLNTLLLFICFLFISFFKTKNVQVFQFFPSRALPCEWNTMVLPQICDLIGWTEPSLEILPKLEEETMASVNVPTQEFWFVTIPNDGSQSQSTFRKLNTAVSGPGLASMISYWCCFQKYILSDNWMYILIWGFDHPFLNIFLS